MIENLTFDKLKYLIGSAFDLGLAWREEQPINRSSTFLDVQSKRREEVVEILTRENKLSKWFEEEQQELKYKALGVIADHCKEKVNLQISTKQSMGSKHKSVEWEASFMHGGQTIVLRDKVAGLLGGSGG